VRIFTLAAPGNDGTWNTRMEEMVARARAQLARRKETLLVSAAHEGEEIILDASPVAP
jgi:hypothetical protein